MKYDLSQIELSTTDERMLLLGIEKDSVKQSEPASIFFLKAKDGYKNFDFSQLDEFNKYELAKARRLFYEDDELSSRPLLFTMYIFHRNGFLDKSFFSNKDRVFNLVASDFLSRRNLNIPEGFIDEKGKLYGNGPDGHTWLYYFLNLSGVDTSDFVRYGQFVQSYIDPVSKKAKIEKTQHFSIIKDLSGKKLLYLSDEQAIAINNLRSYYNPEIPLQSFLLKHTSDFGFNAIDNPSLFACNFDVFAQRCPREPLDKSEMSHIIRVERENTKNN